MKVFTQPIVSSYFNHHTYQASRVNDRLFKNSGGSLTFYFSPAQSTGRTKAVRSPVTT